MSNKTVSILKSYQPPSPEDVRKLRKRHDLTQAQLAEMAMVNERTAQRWEAIEKTLSHKYPSAASWALVLHAVGEDPLPRKRRK
jgi:DNA-binding transcriptional regulator YiaG